MQLPVSLESFQFANESIEVFVPGAAWMEEQYKIAKSAGREPAFPYWAQVWPAAKAMCEMLAVQPSIVKDKQVVELAAGIGLPSLLASRFAKNVSASDHIPGAVEIMRRSILHNKIGNMQTAVMDWNNIDDGLNAEVLLLSDVNYDPASFDILYKLVQRFINQGTQILLSAPQRLSGKIFMEKLLPWCRQQEEFAITHNENTIYTSVWLLHE